MRGYIGRQAGPFLAVEPVELLEQFIGHGVASPGIERTVEVAVRTEPHAEQAQKMADEDSAHARHRRRRKVGRARRVAQ